MKITEWERRLDPKEMRIGVAVSDFNQAVTKRLLEGALSYLERAGVPQVDILRVAGAWELPAAALTLLKDGCDGVIAVGAIIKGETDHYEVIVRSSAAGLIQASLIGGQPVANAVLAAHDLAQALARSEPGPANKGSEAAAAVVDLVARVGNS
ncbi:MAG TPA: 6,7-dimethyl-8-ribityllumazine synthase [Acidimicrobiia bacterium]|nr:6,7-dimethyl-8-ribityllumazine synthase [Acidimicrobiia bacterium]